MDLLHKFTVNKKLGSGAYGHVWKVEPTDRPQQVLALKKVFDAFQHRTDAQRTFREISILKKLDHPNIIKNYGYFSDEDNFYTIMELGCDGQLYDIISSGETLTEESTSYIIGNLLEAVNLMHRHKILHRDIKPENIVLVHVSLQ